MGWLAQSGSAARGLAQVRADIAAALLRAPCVALDVAGLRQLLKVRRHRPLPCQTADSFIDEELNVSMHCFTCH